MSNVIGWLTLHHVRPSRTPNLDSPSMPGSVGDPCVPSLRKQQNDVEAKGPPIRAAIGARGVIAWSRLKLHELFTHLRHLAHQGGNGYLPLIAFPVK
jgi:hypothetical protein